VSKKNNRTQVKSSPSSPRLIQAPLGFSTIFCWHSKKLKSKNEGQSKGTQDEIHRRGCLGEDDPFLGEKKTKRGKNPGLGEVSQVFMEMIEIMVYNGI